MEQCCPNTMVEDGVRHNCACCGNEFGIEGLTVVDHKAVCLRCARTTRIPSEREAIATIIVSSIALAATVAIYAGGFVALMHQLWG